MIDRIGPESVKKAFLAGALSLKANKEWINTLNVFPVPDGDTGTNMTLTVMSAAEEVAAIDDPTMDTICRAMSSGSLKGARGNSGVILSQLLRGFTKGIKGHDYIDVPLLAASFERGTETAYKAVMKPKEGTILTVARGMYEKAKEIADTTEDIVDFCTKVISYGEEVLAKTPDMLPVLKQAGVVDSGGQGLIIFMQGVVDALSGKEIDYTQIASRGPVSKVGATTNSDEEIKFGYCTEFIIKANKKISQEDVSHMKSFLLDMGDSIVCVEDDGILKIHVHTNDPGLVLQKALSYGKLTHIKIDNMREEHNEILFKTSADDKKKEVKKEEPRKQYGFIAIAAGEGFVDIFKQIGADRVIEGGQTMNPSTQDILDAASKINADNIFVFPNNKNIIMAAEQAISLCKDKNIIVIPTKTVPQGISALISFLPGEGPVENKQNMIDQIGTVKSAQITYAIRDTSIDNVEIKKDDIMGFNDRGIVTSGRSIEKVTMDTIDSIIDDDTSLVSIYFGKDIEKESADNISKALGGNHPEVEFEVNYGGQPVYYYLISAE